jgi:hypothetical protein
LPEHVQPLTLFLSTKTWSSSRDIMFSDIENGHEDDVKKKKKKFLEFTES